MVWVHVDDVPERKVVAGIRVRTMWTAPNGAKAQVVHIDAGARWPGTETHEPGPEEVYVVAGVFDDGVREYPAGSFIHCPAGSSHAPGSREGCTLFLFYPEG